MSEAIINIIVALNKVPVLGPSGTTLVQVFEGWLLVGVRANSEETLWLVLVIAILYKVSIFFL